MDSNCVIDCCWRNSCFSDREISFPGPQEPAKASIMLRNFLLLFVVRSFSSLPSLIIQCLRFFFQYCHNLPLYLEMGFHAFNLRHTLLWGTEYPVMHRHVNLVSIWRHNRNDTCILTRLTLNYKQEVGKFHVVLQEKR
jgi:hypothetical protein